jgi:hypothetical protein
VTAPARQVAPANESANRAAPFPYAVSTQDIPCSIFKSSRLVRRGECVPKKLGPSPMLTVHWQTIALFKSRDVLDG